MRKSRRVATVAFLATAFAACSGDGDGASEGVSCAADGICQPSCAADPDCAGGGTGGAASVGDGGAAAAAGGGVNQTRAEVNCTASECCWVECGEATQCGATTSTLCELPAWFEERSCQITEQIDGRPSWIEIHFECPCWSADGSMILGAASAFGPDCPDASVQAPECPDVDAECGGGTASGGSDGSGGSGGSEELCPSPYRCNPDEKEIDGLMREYMLEQCNPRTGEWTLADDCSEFGCSCHDISSRESGENYAQCDWAGEVCNGIRYEW